MAKMVIIRPKKETAMNKDYQIISKKNSRELANFLSKEGQLLLPMLELIEQAENTDFEIGFVWVCIGFVLGLYWVCIGFVLGLYWVCFSHVHQVSNCHNPLFYQKLRSFGLFGNWVCFA